jgi:hypothetical protein
MRPAAPAGPPQPGGPFAQDDRELGQGILNEGLGFSVVSTCQVNAEVLPVALRLATG